MGCPIVPNPINPTFSLIILLPPFAYFSPLESPVRDLSVNGAARHDNYSFLNAYTGFHARISLSVKKYKAF
jgi:hypothetical protein